MGEEKARYSEKMKERGVARFGVWIVFGRGYNLLEAKQYCLRRVFQQKHVHLAQGALYPDADKSCPPLEN